MKTDKLKTTIEQWYEGYTITIHLLKVYDTDDNIPTDEYVVTFYECINPDYHMWAISKHGGAKVEDLSKEYWQLVHLFMETLKSDGDAILNNPFDYE
tara:strand:- start:158 stop:448 length:291 start_codon:yes stop_codon:yes gene_type:complete